MTQRNVLPIASIPCGGYNRPIELPHLETFPGAACYQPIELPCYKAAPLQAVWSARHAACLQPFCVPFSSFKRSGVFWVTRPSDFASVLVVERASLARTILTS
jgi:hypothetical protein